MDITSNITSDINTDITANRRLAGASVLPYCCDPSHNNIYFLLGAEKRLPKWVDSNKWADFGGSPKQNEDDAACAGREFHEETVACVKWNEKEGDNKVHFIRQSSLPIIQDLKKGNFSFKMVTLIDDDRYYTTYVKQVPFDGSIHRRTNTLLSSLGRIRLDIRNSGKHEMNTFEKTTVQNHPSVQLNMEEECIHVSKDFLEKQSIQWVSIPQLQESLKADVSNNHSRSSYILRDSFKGRISNILEQFNHENVRLNNEKLSAVDITKYFPTHNGPPQLTKFSKIDPIDRGAVRVEYQQCSKNSDIIQRSSTSSSRPEQQMFTVGQSASTVCRS